MENTIEVGNVYSKLSGPRLPFIINKFRVFNSAAIYAYQYKLYKNSRGKHGWDGYHSLVRSDGRVLSGLVPRIVTALDGDVKLIDSRPLIPKPAGAVSVPLRDYQKEVVKAAVCRQWQGWWWPRGVLDLSTGAGKTEIAVALWQLFQVPAFFLVHRLLLLHQTVDRFRKYGVEPGIVGGGKFQISPGVTVSTIQSMNSILKTGDQRTEQLMVAIDRSQMLILDECHYVGGKVANDSGNTFTSISAKFSAPIRWGLSATPFMTSKISDWTLEGVTGSSIATIQAQELVGKKFLTPAEVSIYPINHPQAGVPNVWPDAYSLGIVLNTHRNKKIVEIAKSMPRPYLVLTETVVHGELLQKMLAEDGNRVGILNYTHKNKDRASLVGSLKSGDLDCLVLSTIFDEGIDIPEIRAIIMAGGKKQKKKTIQRLGRGIRLDEGKKTVKIIDFKDTTCEILKKHSSSRISTYESEGHKVTLLNN